MVTYVSPLPGYVEALNWLPGAMVMPSQADARRVIVQEKSRFNRSALLR